MANSISDNCVHHFQVNQQGSRFERQYNENENRVRMKELCQLAGSYLNAAKLIAIQTQRPLSIESIKAWTCNPATKRARRCPDWAITALERQLRKCRRKRLCEN